MKIQIGAVEKLFGLVLLLYVGLAFFHPANLIRDALALPVAALGLWSTVRICREPVRLAMWRLRNRLIVAYIFIALVPIVLITVLFSLGASLLAGQVSVFLIGSELERRSAGLRATTEYVVAHEVGAIDWSANMASFIRARYPGLVLLVKGKQNWTFPPDAALKPPNGWPENSGLVLKDGSLYGWAHLIRESREVTALYPITREYLGTLAPGLGATSIVDWPTHRHSGDRAIVGGGQTLPASDATLNRLPPAANWLDIELLWVTPVPIALWDNPGKFENEFLYVQTRPSAILRTVFSEEVDFAGVIWLLIFSAASLFLIAEVFAVMIGFSLSKGITGAVHDLYTGTQKVTKGDFSHRISDLGTDQLGALGASFNQMTGNLQRLVEVEKEKERLHAEIEIAREVQHQLYPKTVPSLKSLRMQAHCDPARLVSGDYYDYQQLNDAQVAIAIGDVAGKGISAALLMATVQSCFRTQLQVSLGMSATVGGVPRFANISTSALVTSLNQQLHAFTAPEKFATFYFGLYDEPAGTLTYTNAGHLPPALIRKGKATRLDVNGTVVGAFPFSHYDSSVIRLEPGDLLVFFTDGVTEPENEYGEEFSEDRLIDLAIKNADLDDTSLLRLITQSVRDWSATEELQDDMTLLLIRSMPV